MTLGKVIAVKYKKKTMGTACIKLLNSCRISNHLIRFHFLLTQKNSLGNKPKKKGMNNYPWRE